MFMQKNRKIRNYLIYPQFQWRLILFFQMYMFNSQIENAQSMNLPETHPFFIFYNQFQKQSLMILGLGILISFIISFVLGFVISHRVAGPLVKLKRHFEAVAQDAANDKSINFREKDYFKEVAEAYNLRFIKKNS